MAHVQLAGDVRRRHADHERLARRARRRRPRTGPRPPTSPASAPRRRRVRTANPSRESLGRSRRGARQLRAAAPQGYRGQLRSLSSRGASPQGSARQPPSTRIVLVPCAQRRPCASSIRASVVATRRPGWMTEPVQRITPVSTVRARVKFDFTSSVVQPDGLVQRRDEREPHRRVHERHGEPCVDDADRVVVELGRLALEERVAALGLDEPESERLRDRRRWRSRLRPSAA